MKPKPAIIVNSLSKTYKLYNSRYDRIKEWFHPLRKKYHVKHQALKEVSFILESGEVLGVIGQNGSGKSTLLKILNSVVFPTLGGFVVNGRISALLELSAGFNPVLTGIENIYFLSAINGHKRKMIENRVAEIIAFAELGEYVYQPVKTYSSGMHIRLAFSLAINIDPDILIIDEALAVGDLRFQQKCFRKIKEFKESGKTIIMCTHSLTAVKEFCDRAIWLHEGVIKEDGMPEIVTQNYTAYMLSNQAANMTEPNNERS